MADFINATTAPLCQAFTELVTFKLNGGGSYYYSLCRGVETTGFHDFSREKDTYEIVGDAVRVTLDMDPLFAAYGKHRDYLCSKFKGLKNILVDVMPKDFVEKCPKVYSAPAAGNLCFVMSIPKGSVTHVTQAAVGKLDDLVRDFAVEDILLSDFRQNLNRREGIMNEIRSAEAFCRKPESDRHHCGFHRVKHDFEEDEKNISDQSKYAKSFIRTVFSEGSRETVNRRDVLFEQAMLQARSVVSHYQKRAAEVNDYVSMCGHGD